jgi:cell fate regulator YaaT (PSP1 superfamily)
VTTARKRGPGAPRCTMDNDLVGIRYVEAGPLHYCSPGELRLGTGDYVIIPTDRGERLGWVVVTPEQVIAARPEGPIRVVDRLASADEVEMHRQQKRRAEEDITRAQAAAARVDPRVRVASLSYDLTGKYAELTFAARENAGDVIDRVEREVARALDLPDLLAEQVGDRDRAKAIGGVGQCGRGLCCSTWMTEFPAISIKMAKDQGLAPNPSKISGVCGRLLCCLSFEVEAYRDIVGSLPKVGKKLTTPAGKAKVLSINALTEMVRLRFEESGQIIEISTDAVKRQMGTTLRPDELDAEFEEALREKDRRRSETLVAVMTPVDRPLRDASAAGGPVIDEEERTARRQRSERRSGSDRPRREPSSGTRDGASGGTAAPAEGGRRSGSGPRRRRSGSGTGAGAGTNQPRGERSGAPAGESRSGIRITRRRSGEPAPGAQPRAEDGAGAPRGGRRDGADTPTDGARPESSDEQKRRRRRGRRGGRRRGAGEGGEGGTSTPTPSGE